MFLPDYQTRIVDRLFDSPNGFVPMFDEEKEAALVVPMTRESYSQSVFLDWRTQRAAEEAELIPIRSIEQTIREKKIGGRSLRFIIHPAFAGSTLLCRCLDHPGLCLPYKEPHILAQISMDRRDSFVSGEPGGSLITFDLALALLSRSYSPAEEVVIKPSDSCINIARDLLGHHPQSMGILLNLPLEEFVVSNLKRSDRREFMQKNIPRARVDLSAMELLQGVDIERLSDGEAAAFVWFALMIYYLDILRDCSLRVRTLDAATFYRNPCDTLKALVSFFDLSLTTTHINEAVDKNVFVRDSKHPSIKFDVSSKATENLRLRSQLSREIDDAREWIEQHTRDFPIPKQLPRPLLKESE